MSNSQPYIDSLLAAEPLRKPLMQSIIEALQLPTGSRGLDVGCGIGLQALLLAKATGEQGHVTGIDILPELLKFAKCRRIRPDYLRT